MGVVEMYRETGNPRYLELSKNLINIRGMVQNGTDDNQDRIPFRQQYNAMGHAVRANYLYAGVADVLTETGEEQLMKTLPAYGKILVTRKMYIQVLAELYMMELRPMAHITHPILYRKFIKVTDVLSVTKFNTHNETCANMWNLLSIGVCCKPGEAKYADLVETVIYNSVLSGISLEENAFSIPIRFDYRKIYLTRCVGQKSVKNI
jgi:DUF1680 family protein